MLNEKALIGLGRILLLSDPKDVKMLEIRTVPGMPKSRSRREAIATILQRTENPAKLLHHQTVKKAILAEYLRQTGYVKPKDLTKDDCIRICLENWGVEDSTLEKYHTEDEVVQALSRLDEEMQKKIDEIRLRYKRKKKPLLDNLNSLKKSRSSSVSPSIASPSSSSSQFAFPTATPKAHARKPATSKKPKTSEDEVSIIMKKMAKSSSPATSTPKLEKICVTPDVKPDPSTLFPRLESPDSSDTASMFWVSW